MELNSNQKKLLNELIKDQENSSKLFKPGPYWSYKCKKAADWIYKKGYSDFRGLTSPVGTSYADGMILDKRNELGLGIKSRLANFISKLPVFKSVYEAQIKLTEAHIRERIKTKSTLYFNNKRVKYFLENYDLRDTVSFGSVQQLKINQHEYSFLHLDNIDIIDMINKKIDLKGINSYFEIGGGFGANIQLLLNNFKNIKKVLYLDVAPSLFIGTEYLRTYFGNSVKDYLQLKDKKISFTNDDKLEILCIPPWVLPDTDLEIDHFHNSCSFAEMTFDIVNNYSKFIKKFLKKGGNISLHLDRLDNTRYVSNDDMLKMFDLSFSHDEYRDLCDSDFHDLYLLKN